MPCNAIAIRKAQLGDDITQLLMDVNFINKHYSVIINALNQLSLLSNVSLAFKGYSDFYFTYKNVDLAFSVNYDDGRNVSDTTGKSFGSTRSTIVFYNRSSESVAMIDEAEAYIKGTLSQVAIDLNAIRNIQKVEEHAKATGKVKAKRETDRRITMQIAVNAQKLKQRLRQRRR